MMKLVFTWCFALAVVFNSSAVHGQNRSQLIKEADSIYQVNILKSRINGVYIPKDLDDAFAELDRLSPPEALEKIRVEDEIFIAQKLHYGLGRWMAYNWNFDEGSRFSHYLKGLGLFYTQEMIDFVLISYHRYLNKKPQEVEVRVKQYIEKRKKKG